MSSKGAKTLEITTWIHEQRVIPSEIKEAYQEFMKTSQLQPSYSQFQRVCKKETNIQNIKTGGVYAVTSEVISCLYCRSKYGINRFNTIAIDEKPFNFKKYAKVKVRKWKKVRGLIPANQVKNTQCKTTINPIYALCAISINGIESLHLESQPYNITSFNEFLNDLEKKINFESENHFIIIDNASFHQIDEDIERRFMKKGYYFIRNPPRACFLNPIEEFFGDTHQKLKSLIRERNLIDQKMTNDSFKMSIIDAFTNAAASCNFEKLYKNSLLL